MSSLILPRRFTKAPESPLDLDFNEPLSWGLVASFTQISRGSLVGVIPSRGRVPYVRAGGSPTRKWRNEGLTSRFSGVGTSTGFTSIGGVTLFATATQQWSVSVAGHPDTGQTGALVAKASATTAARTFQIFSTYVTDATQSPGIYLRGTLTSTNLGHQYEWHHYTLTWDGTTAWFYYDRSVYGSVPVGTAVEETSEPICIGARTGGTGYPLTGDIAFTHIWNRAISFQEHLALNDNPYCVYRQTPLILPRPVATIGYPVADTSKGAWSSDVNLQAGVSKSIFAFQEQSYKFDPLKMSRNNKWLEP